MKKPKAVVLVVIIVLSIIIVYFSAIIIRGILTDYQPDDILELQIEGNAETTPIHDLSFTFLSWNIGYGGLGAETDFFYDGGEQVHPEPDHVNKYTAGILNILNTADTVDFILLQEVDKNSKRTNYQDQVQMVQERFPDYSSSFAYNYKVRFVPLPFFNPLGRVEMGQMNLSKYIPISSQRYSYYSAYSWPKRLFMLDRCFVVSTFLLDNGKNLIMINTHNSAYDADGKLRKQEMPLIRDFMLKEFEKGNYVVAGGDWNQNPPGYEAAELETGNDGVERVPLDASLFPDGWKIVYDPLKPTNREVEAPFSEGSTKVTVIDYFIVSPNVEIEEIEVLSQNFANSDHEPVFMKVSLK